MKVIFKRILTVAVAVSLAMGLTSCDSTTNVTRIDIPTEISFSWWGKDVRNDYTVSGINAFERLNADTSVDYDYGEFEGFKDRMDIEIASGTQADVMQINYNWLEEYDSIGAGFYDLSQLGDYIGLNNFESDVLNYGMVNGKLVGIPIALNSETAYYNKSIYDQYGLSLPTTWEDWFNAAKVMSKDGIYPVVLGRKAMWMVCVAYAEQVSGKQFITDDNELGFGESEVRIMLEFYQRLINEKVTNVCESVDRTDILNEKVAGCVLWISDADYYLSNAISLGMDIVVGDYPTINGEELSGWYAKPTSLYCIRGDTQNVEAAATLVDFLLNSEEMVVLQRLEKGVPVSKSAQEILSANQLLYGIQKDATAALHDNGGVKVMNSNLENQTYINMFIEANEKILYGEATVEEMATFFSSQVYL